MLFRNAILVLMALPLASAESLRKRNLENLRSPKAPECVILVRSDLHLDAGVDDGEEFECVLDPNDAAGGIAGTSLPIDLTHEQKKELKDKLKRGDLVSDSTTLKFEDGFKISDKAVHVPKEKTGLALGKKKKGAGNRHLAIVSGDKPILVVKVKDVNGLERSETSSQISDDVFGTINDPVNLKSQMSACSFGQLNITPGLVNDPDPNEVAPGVIEVQIGISLTNNDRYTIRNAVTSAVTTKLGHGLPGPYQQVMYVLENCYTDCGWAAYAYINSWNSVYQSHYYKQTGVQMHELGHNFNLAHSGGLDGATYTDHTGLMGNPLYSDDVGKMCWNAAKTWQIRSSNGVGWYDDSKILIDPRSGPWSGRLVGIADYDNNPANNPVVVKVETGTATDQFIAFNRAIGVNSQNDQADDQVTVVETGNNGEGYSQSWLKATLAQGQVYTYSNWAGTGQNLVITAITINIGTSPGYADISVCLGSCDTNAPTKSPTAAPTKSRVPTAAPTRSPTLAPTQTQTANPTVSCSSIISKSVCNERTGCAWSGNPKRGSCSSTNPSPTPAPRPTTPRPSPSPGSCNWGSKDLCISNGCRWINVRGNKTCST